MHFPLSIADGTGRVWYRVGDMLTDVYEASDDRDDLLRYAKIVTMYGLASNSPVARTP
jgi:hypothetical protein